MVGKMNGYIKLHRSMLDWEWLDDAATLQVWIYCLLHANYETQRWHGILIKPGQFVTSYAHMAKDLHTTVRSVRTSIKHLKVTHEVTSQVTNNATLITIEKWGEYQSAGEKVTSQVTHEVTSQRQASDKPVTTNKEREERKEEEENREIKEREFIPNGHGAFSGAWYSEVEA